MYLEEGLVEDIREEVVKILKSFGIKHTLKKSDYKLQVEKRIELYHVFKTALELLEKDKVFLPQCGVQVSIPVFVIDSCKFIEQNLLVEGLFRKAGSTSKQRELRALLDCGNRLEITDEHHVINVANILKLFFRELPEPLIPFKFHSTFLRCLSVKQKKTEALLLSCLLLPNDHLNTLVYLLTFLNNVTLHKDVNKMDVGNLAIIFTPSIMPVNAAKFTVQGSDKINHHVLIVQTLIENAAVVGVVPESVCDKLGYLNMSSSSTVELDTSQNASIKTRRKKRSNSLTKMITGIKKIMSKPSPEPATNAISPRPNLMMYTPNMVSTRKRKTESQGISSKKRCEVINSLPGKLALANTPRKIKYSSTTMLTPRTLITDFKRTNCTPANKQNPKELPPSKKLGLKDSSTATGTLQTTDLNKTEGKVVPERAVLSKAASLSQSSDGANCEKAESEEFIRIPKHEFEEIKMRVNNIENCLENELDNILGVTISDLEDSHNETNGKWASFSNVETAYTKTIEESGKLSFKNDAVSQSLQRGLRIRRNSEQVIRSPSARKIGSIRRRSRELGPLKSDLFRQSSLNIGNRSPREIQRANQSGRCLRRGRPNTVYTGLPEPSQQPHNDDNLDIKLNDNISKNQLPPEPEKKKVENNPSKNDSWESADAYFSKPIIKDLRRVDDCARDSIAKIRDQNMGMVLNKAKLFDQLLIDSIQNDCENTANSSKLKQNNKIKSKELVQQPTLISIKNRLSPRGLQKSKFSQSSSTLNLKNINPKVRPSKSFNSTPASKLSGILKSPPKSSERLKLIKRNQAPVTSPRRWKKPGERTVLPIQDNKRKPQNITTQTVH